MDSRGRVLIVEDDGVFAYALSRALVKHAAVEVDVASDRDAACAFVRANAYVAIVADLHLRADRDAGYELLAIARSLRPEARRILMTGERTVDERAQIADDVLNKPFDNRTLVSLVTRTRDG